MVRKTSLTRREFVRSLGVALAGFVISGCDVVRDIAAKPTPTSRQRLRDVWMKFDELAEQTRKDSEKNNQDWELDAFGEKLKLEHQAALDTLVADGSLDSEVAKIIAEAYLAAEYHVWRSNVPITCYAPMIVDYGPSSAQHFVDQAKFLAEFAHQGTITPDTLSRAQTALEHDMAFIVLTDQEEKALIDQVILEMGSEYNPPDYESLALEISPEAANAARFLVELLANE